MAQPLSGRRSSRSRSLIQSSTRPMSLAVLAGNTSAIASRTKISSWNIVNSACRHRSCGVILAYLASLPRLRAILLSASSRFIVAADCFALASVPYTGFTPERFEHLQATMKYFFGLRVTNHSGRWIAAGPYDTYEEAKITYYASEAPDRELSPPFLAESKARAEAILARQA